MKRRAWCQTVLGSSASSLLALPENYFSHQRIGANCFNQLVTPQWLAAAKQADIRLVRLAYEKWGTGDFLLGSADEYRGLVASDLKKLIGVLDQFSAHELKILLVPISMPGCRWRQRNNNRRDGRLWKDFAFWRQSNQYWRDLARALRDHPAIAGFDLMNEPAPELEYGRDNFEDGKAVEFQEKLVGKSGDWNALSQQLYESISEVDTKLPVIIETTLFATPWAISTLQPIKDPRVYYSVHMYEPYSVTTWRLHKGARKYPEANLDAAWLDRFFDPVREWLRRHQVAADRLLIGEFGCGRRVAGAGEYLEQLISLFDREGWHWLFYSFREDTWDGMDYELGPGTVPAAYWEASEQGRLSAVYPKIYGSRNELWEVFRNRLSKQRS
jgi:endoglucanase